ncbi:hypothetical protein acdb102_15970 [Acidothermaceae bacterium B102]|nr:hypothetical protein acdb102_15970 [Acidothermaceae bacterium B102]
MRGPHNDPTEATTPDWAGTSDDEEVEGLNSPGTDMTSQDWGAEPDED